jgi:hypothetical protein
VWRLAEGKWELKSWRKNLKRPYPCAELYFTTLFKLHELYGVYTVAGLCYALKLCPFEYVRKYSRITLNGASVASISKVFTGLGAMFIPCWNTSHGPNAIKTGGGPLTGYTAKNRCAFRVLYLYSAVQLSHSSARETVTDVERHTTLKTAVLNG